MTPHDYVSSFRRDFQEQTYVSSIVLPTVGVEGESFLLGSQPWTWMFEEGGAALTLEAAASDASYLWDPWWQR